MVGPLTDVAKRLSGGGGEPVIQLQTVLGGGKTHSMLALYHLFGLEKPLGRVPDGEKVIRASSLSEMPVANRSVLVGTDLDVSAHPPCTVRTDSTPKVRFSAKLSEEPAMDVELA